jgi:predicted RNase H-like nuclease
MPPFTSIIGVDCATKANKVGVARARYVAGAWHLDHALGCSSSSPPTLHLANWIREDRNALLALDAPLGWPVDLPRALQNHRAGEPVDAQSETMFNRATDRFLYRTLGKRPLDVGADRIARTALAALDMLQRLREEVGEQIPLAWSADGTDAPAAIEVYPAATLDAHGIQAKRYKRDEHGEGRRSAIDFARSRLVDETNIDLAGVQHDVLDAILCVVAGIDFLEGEAHPPEDPDIAAREGWIWVRETAKTCARETAAPPKRPAAGTPR